MAELDRDTLFKKLRSKPDNKVGQLSLAVAGQVREPLRFALRAHSLLAQRKGPLRGSATCE